MVSHRARMANLPIVFVNLVGGNDGVIFDGASIISDATGKIILQAPPFEEFIETVDLDCGIPDSRCLPGDDIETIRSALCSAFATMRKKTTSRKYCWGCPAESIQRWSRPWPRKPSVQTTLLAVTMPFALLITRQRRRFDRVKPRLGVECRTKPISDAFHVLRNELELPEPSIENKSAMERAVENLQSRLRGNILMTISNAEIACCFLRETNLSWRSVIARFTAIQMAGWP